MLLSMMAVLVLLPSEPRYVFKTEVTTPAFIHCYKIPAPEGSSALWCDVDDPATHDKYVLNMISNGGTALQRSK